MSCTVDAVLTHEKQSNPNSYKASLKSETPLSDTLKSTGGFDIAVLTHKTEGEAIPHKALPISETSLKERLFLLSIADLNLSNQEKKRKRTQNRKKITHKEDFAYKDKTYRVNAAKSG
ncbi:MAG: hypothetical protein QNK15_07850, partial [Cycloclasticus sp.]|nr:hypothetical protein [Cycloclasticus sp.]